MGEAVTAARSCFILDIFELLRSTFDGLLLFIPLLSRSYYCFVSLGELLSTVPFVASPYACLRRNSFIPLVAPTLA